MLGVVRTRLVGNRDVVHDNRAADSKDLHAGDLHLSVFALQVLSIAEIVNAHGSLVGAHRNIFLRIAGQRINIIFVDQTIDGDKATHGSHVFRVLTAEINDDRRFTGNDLEIIVQGRAAAGFSVDPRGLGSLIQLDKGRSRPAGGRSELVTAALSRHSDRAVARIFANKLVSHFGEQRVGRILSRSRRGHHGESHGSQHSHCQHDAKQFFHRKFLLLMLCLLWQFTIVLYRVP